MKGLALAATSRVISRRTLIGSLVGASGLAAIDGCAQHSNQDDLAAHPKPPGTVVSLRQLGWYPAVINRMLLGAAKVEPSIPVATDFTPYRLVYWSTTNGAPVLVSALVSVPSGGKARGVVLWMHGTNPDRSKSVSTPSVLEGLPVSAAFAGGGYIVIAPDLVGLGVSKAPQAYLYNPSTIAVTLDLLLVVAGGLNGLLSGLPRNLFIAGFSQGGHDAAVIHQALEALPDSPLRVQATAAVAGAYDLAGLSIPFALQGRSTGDSLYLGLLAQSYATYGGRPLDTVLTIPASKLIRATLDGDHGSDDLNVLPRDPREMFRPDVLNALAGGGPHWFLDAARANGVRDWTPKAPFRAYFGTHDVDVSPQESLGFAQSAARRGGAVEALAVGPYDHGESVLHAVPLIRTWFDALSAAA